MPETIDVTFARYNAGTDTQELEIAHGGHVALGADGSSLAGTFQPLDPPGAPVPIAVLVADYTGSQAQSWAGVPSSAGLDFGAPEGGMLPAQLYARAGKPTGTLAVFATQGDTDGLLLLPVGVTTP